MKGSFEDYWVERDENGQEIFHDRLLSTVTPIRVVVDKSL